MVRQTNLQGIRAFTGGFLLGGSLGYVAVWETDDAEGESMRSVEEEYHLSTAAKVRNVHCVDCKIPTERFRSFLFLILQSAALVHVFTSWPASLVSLVSLRAFIQKSPSSDFHLQGATGS